MPLRMRKVPSGPLSLCVGLAGAALLCLGQVVSSAELKHPVPSPLPIVRLDEPIKVDGDLSDPGWQKATPIETWFETNPGDNLPPRVKSVGYLAYDDRFFYVGLRFDDPEPKKIRAPLGDRDNLSSATDYGGLIIDTRNDGRTAILFLANARGLQYDAVTDDGGSGEDSSPNFYWDSAGRITETGWTLEIRVPFTSLRYPNSDPQTWGIMLYRNYPRDFRYQFFTTRLPKDTNCFVCHSNKLDDLTGLPNAGHLIAAPYLSGSQTAAPEGDTGTPLKNGRVRAHVGMDVKWTPTAGTALDATLNPDFSQVESDVAQISTNERFAIFYPEKRPFFLEGINLFSTPIQAVYTRTITSPQFGARGTGRWGKVAFTGLVSDDRGGGQVVLPGTTGSDFANQDFHSFVAVGRARRDIGASFVSFLASDREEPQGAFNRVLGPDFQWRPSKRDVVSGQLLWSFTRTPQRPDLTSQWDGRSLSGHAADASWGRTTTRYDVYTEGKDISRGFRADNGFIPQVGYREVYLETGYTWRPKRGLIRRFRVFFYGDDLGERGGALLSRTISPGFGLDARWYTFVRVRFAWERARVGEAVETLPRRRLYVTVTSSPSRLLSGISLDGYVGRDIDYDGVRRGSGGKVVLGMPLRLTDHLEVRLDEEVRWLNVDVGARSQPWLFTARVDRLRTTYTLTSRAFARVIGQYVSTRRDPSLYASSVARSDGQLTASALIAYKLDWQTVLYAGYGDDRELSTVQPGDRDRLVRTGRQFFVKVSYAFQR